MVVGVMKHVMSGRNCVARLSRSGGCCWESEALRGQERFSTFRGKDFVFADEPILSTVICKYRDLMFGTFEITSPFLNAAVTASSSLSWIS